jgi:hypothetical protein
MCDLTFNQASMTLVTGVNAMEEIASVSAVGQELGDRDLHVKHPVVLDTIRRWQTTIDGRSVARYGTWIIDKIRMSGRSVVGLADGEPPRVFPGTMT